MPSSKTKGFFCGGGPTRVNIIETITFASLGNAVDFGDAASGSHGKYTFANFSNGHGGL